MDSVDNLPVTAMSSMGPSTIFACDVGSVRIPIVIPGFLVLITSLRSMIIHRGVLGIRFLDGGS